MYSPLQLAKKYLRYYLTANNGKGHGIHSPFVYQLVREVLNDKRHFYAYDRIENLRQDLLQKKDIIEVEDFGAGSGTGATKQRSIRSIAKNAAKPKKLGQLLFRLVLYFQPEQVLELGTSLGMTTAYLAAAKASAQVVTIEGSETVAAEARYHFFSLKLHNIRQVTGNFDILLPSVLTETGNVDFAFIDGNHRFEPTVRYFREMLPHLHNDSVLVFDDIHWSEEMEQAWAFIQNHDSVRLTVDLFFIGLVFFRQEIKEKQHFTIRF